MSYTSWHTIYKHNLMSYLPCKAWRSPKKLPTKLTANDQEQNELYYSLSLSVLGLLDVQHSKPYETSWLEKREQNTSQQLPLKLFNSERYSSAQNGVCLSRQRGN